MWDLVNIFSVDAETDGLYGPVWAIGAVVLDDHGAEVAWFAGQLNPDVVTDPWVRENIVPVVDLPRLPTRQKLLNDFWWFWMEYREGALAVADFGAPVEAGLFRACVSLSKKERTFQGPHPLHELGTALLLAGLDPDCDRRELCGRPDLVRHNPVDDAMMAGLCWQVAVEKIERERHGSTGTTVITMTPPSRTVYVPVDDPRRRA